MKRLPVLLLFVILSLSAAAQFPLGSTMPEIKTYFGENVPYSFVQEFRADNGDLAICFTKSKGIGDFTFYFDNNGVCSSYIVTYGKEDFRKVESLLDHKYCRLEVTRWVSEEGKFDVDVFPPETGANYFSVIYTSDPLLSDLHNNTLVSTN
jgi:hypothetical protein